MPYVWSSDFPPRLVYVPWDTDIPNKNRQANNSLIGNTFAYVKGKMFDRWIDYTDGDARSNGLSEDGLIDCPPYIIEDILRSYVKSERDLRITTVTDTTHIIVAGLKSSVNDFYNYAIYFNVSNNFKTYITDYVGATNTLVLASADVNATADNNIFITNIKGSETINEVAFDAIGNTNDGLRKDWVFGRSIAREETAESTMAQLCYESWCKLYTSHKKFNLVALDTASSGDTWTTPLKAKGKEFFDIKLTPLMQVFSSFRLRYAYSYSIGDYVKEFYIDKNGYTSGGSVISSTEQGLCSDAETNYRVKNKFEYSSDWIYDITTAEYFLQKAIEWFTKQRLQVTWTTPLHDSNFDYIKYELGDQVKLNNSRVIPTGINNSSYFMINHKTVIMNNGSPYIIFKLFQMG